jgi:hypothetical protein
LFFFGIILPICYLLSNKVQPLNHRRNTLLLILIASVIRAVAALSTELGNDEVYYRLYAEHLQWNYFDHPPMVGWLIRLTTCNLWLDTTFTVRLGAILSAAAASWLLYLCGKRLYNAYTGFLAVALYTATLYGSIIAGTFILPDSPQMVCWIAALYFLIKITSSKTLSLKTTKDILWFGVVTGIGMLCKIHTAFLWIGFGLYMLMYSREWLSSWTIYVSAFITAIFFLPVIIWNVQNDFITFFFHGKRVDVASGGLNVQGLITFMGGQILYCNPVVFYLIARAVWPKLLPIKLSQKRILLLVSLPLIILATSVSLFKDLLPHWTGPAFSGLILLTACHLAQNNIGVSKKLVLPILPKVALGFILLIVITGIVGVNFFPGTLGSKENKITGDGDFTLDMYGWRKFAVSFDSIYYSAHLANNKNNQTIIVANKWFPAANIDYYVAQPLGIRTVATGSIDEIHQYHWLNTQRGLVKDSTDLYIISPSNYLIDIATIEVVKNKLPARIDTVIQKRGGALARKFYIYYYKKDKYVFTAASF